MKTLRFTIEIELAADTVFAPGTDEKFMATELAIFVTRMMAFYAAGTEPEISVRTEQLDTATHDD